MKKTALIIQSPPYGGRSARNALDMAMACASFEVIPSLFFIEDGVFQLIKEQHSTVIGQKNIASLVKSLPLFDITNIYACTRSINERKVALTDMVVPVKSFNIDELADLLKTFSTVLSF